VTHSYLYRLTRLTRIGLLAAITLSLAIHLTHCSGPSGAGVLALDDRFVYQLGEGINLITWLGESASMSEALGSEDAIIRVWTLDNSGRYVSAINLREEGWWSRGDELVTIQYGGTYFLEVKENYELAVVRVRSDHTIKLEKGLNLVGWVDDFCPFDELSERDPAGLLVRVWSRSQSGSYSSATYYPVLDLWWSADDRLTGLETGKAYFIEAGGALTLRTQATVTEDSWQLLWDDDSFENPAVYTAGQKGEVSVALNPKTDDPALKLVARGPPWTKTTVHRSIQVEDEHVSKICVQSWFSIVDPHMGSDSLHPFDLGHCWVNLVAYTQYGCLSTTSGWVQYEEWVKDWRYFPAPYQPGAGRQAVNKEITTNGEIHTQRLVVNLETGSYESIEIDGTEYPVAQWTDSSGGLLTYDPGWLDMGELFWQASVTTRTENEVVLYIDRIRITYQT
jgi:hypothetical protein